MHETSFNMMDKSIRTLSDKMRVQFFSTQTILPQIQYDFVATKTMPHMTQILYTTSQGTVVFCLVLFGATYFSLFCQERMNKSLIFF